MVEEVWLGATDEVVIEEFVDPAKVEEGVLKTETKRTLSYTGDGECPKCDGIGILVEFAHIKGGTCTPCDLPAGNWPS